MHVWHVCRQHLVQRSSRHDRVVATKDDESVIANLAIAKPEFGPPHVALAHSLHVHVLRNEPPQGNLVPCRGACQSQILADFEDRCERVERVLPNLMERCLEANRVEEHDAFKQVAAQVWRRL